MHAVRLLPGLMLVGALVALAQLANHAVPALSPLSLSVLFGMLVVNARLLRPSMAPGIAFAGRRLMRIGVALLGAEVSLQSIHELGLATVVAIILVVVCTILGVRALARALGLAPDFGLLVGIGYGICGASAVAASASQTKATQQEASYAIALVALCGTLSIAVLPSVAGMLHLSDVLFGRWAGAAVHDVGQVVATASTRSDVALQVAVIVKLARVALLAPVVLLLSLRNRRAAAHVQAAHVAALPLFVASFLVLAALHSVGVIPEAVASATVITSKLCMAFGLAALGLGVRWSELRKLGGRPLLLGLLAWVMVAALALIAVQATSGVTPAG